MMINLYKNFLEDVYLNYINSRDYTDFLQKIKSKVPNPLQFNSEFRDYSLKLSRQLGATSAFKHFIKQHPNKDFLLITTYLAYKSSYEEFIKNEGLTNVKFANSLHGITGTLPRVDIILFDNFSMLFEIKSYESIYNYILTDMNRSRLDQVLIKFQ